MKDNRVRVQFEALLQNLLDNLADPIKKPLDGLVTFSPNNLHEEDGLRRRV